jgi:hypothetical protein
MAIRKDVVAKGIAAKQEALARILHGKEGPENTRAANEATARAEAILRNCTDEERRAIEDTKTGWEH